MFSTLKTDIVQVYVTDYIRADDLVDIITMRQDTPVTYPVPDVYAELTELPGLGFNLDIKVRQPSGSALSWVTIIS